MRRAGLTALPTLARSSPTTTSGATSFSTLPARAPERVPILIEHDRNQRAGVGSLTFGTDIRISGTLLPNEHGADIASESDVGFPWQLSVHIEPGRIEEVQPGQQVSVNGRTHSGPLTIFRDGLIRETSFTPTGA